MTMIRINLIADKKPGVTKITKKPSAGASELQENLLLIIGAGLAIVLVAVMWNLVSSDLQKQVARNATLTAEYNKVKKYQEEKDRFELEKELLNEKIQKISELKDRREGPVKIMEDVHNVLPESVWLTSISQSYDKGLTLATRTDGKAYTPGKNLAEPNLIRVEGKAKTPDAVTAFANKILSLGDRYSNTELNNYELATGKDSGNREINFTLFFKILKGPSKSQSEGS